MANKFVRSMNDVNQKNGKLPLNLTNENDLISTDGKQHYIRRKDDYHCLTDNVKTIKLNGKELKPDSKGEITLDTQFIVVNDYNELIELNIRITKGSNNDFRIDYNTEINFSIGMYNDVDNQMRASVQFIYDFIDGESGEFVTTKKFGNDSNLIDFENNKIEIVGSFTINHTGNGLRIKEKPDFVYTPVLNITNKPDSPTKVLLSLPLLVIIKEREIG